MKKPNQSIKCPFKGRSEQMVFSCNIIQTWSRLSHLHGIIRIDLSVLRIYEKTKLLKLSTLGSFYPPSIHGECTYNRNASKMHAGLSSTNRTGELSTRRPSPYDEYDRTFYELSRYKVERLN